MLQHQQQVVSLSQPACSNSSLHPAGSTPSSISLPPALVAAARLVSSEHPASVSPQRSPSPLTYRRMDSPINSPTNADNDETNVARFPTKTCSPPVRHVQQPVARWPPVSSAAASQFLPFLAGTRSGSGASGVRLPSSFERGWAGITAAGLLARMTSSSAAMTETRQSPSGIMSGHSGGAGSGLVFGIPAGFAAAAAMAAAAAKGRRMSAFGTPLHGLVPPR